MCIHNMESMLRTLIHSRAQGIVHETKHEVYAILNVVCPANKMRNFSISS